jgi:hypothetical protein
MQCTCTWSIIVHSRIHLCRGKAISISYSQSVSAAIFMQHAMSKRRIVLTSVACLAVPYFRTLSQHRHDIREKLTEYKTCHNNVTNLIHFHFHNHFIVSWSSTCVRRQASIFRSHYTSSFWCEFRALVAFSWLQVVGRLAYWAWGCGCRSGA